MTKTTVGQEMRFPVLWAAVAALGCVTLVTGKNATESELLRRERLIGNIITSTTTVLTVSTVSTTVPVSCLVNSLPATACTGRRRRRSAHGTAPLTLDTLTEAGMTRLHGSMAEPDGSANNAAAISKQADHQGRIFLYATRFITVDSVVTSFTTITDLSTTVSFSLGCTIGGQNLLTRRCVLTLVGR